MYKSIYDQAIEGLLVVDASGIIIEANDASQKMFGYDTLDELIGKSVDLLLPENLRAAHQRHRQRYRTNPVKRHMGHGLELQGVKKDGTPLTLEISLNPIEFENEKLVCAHIIDVSQRAKLEKLSRENEAMFTSLVENAVDGIITIDERGIVLSMNPAASRLFGYHEGEVVGKNIHVLMPQPYKAEHDQYIDNYKRTGIKQIIGIGREVKGQRKDGSIFPFSLSISEVTVHEKRIFTGIVHDISAIKEAETRLIRYAEELERSNRELENFAYVSSHDLQEPLRKIQAFGNWLKDKEAENFSEKGADYMARMLSAANRLQRLINDLLSYSRVSTKGEPFAKVNLNQILEYVLSDLEVSIQQKNANIFSTSLPELEADYTQMRQLFQNLISNAIKFSKPDDPPRVEIAYTDAMANLHEEFGRKWGKIQITDNGIGFNEQYKEKIFAIFQRLEGKKFEGSGIGLAIVKRIVQRHGGRIEVESEQGVGTRFTIFLPLSQEKTEVT
ncbi:MAG: PAS domain S-box protein [Bacteroidota bacterium]